MTLKVRAPDTRPEPGSSARAALASEASGQRDDAQLRAPAGTAARLATITNHVFLGNINEYYATLPSGQVLRVQTHPLQRFQVGDEVAIALDAAQCSVFRRE